MGFKNRVDTADLESVQRSHLEMESLTEPPMQHTQEDVNHIVHDLHRTMQISCIS